MALVRVIYPKAPQKQSHTNRAETVAAADSTPAHIAAMEQMLRAMVPSGPGEEKAEMALCAKEALFLSVIVRSFE
jgi:hypothetical protein